MAVASFLGAHNVHPVESSEPMEHVWEAICREGSDGLFITQPIRGWVLVIGRWTVGEDPESLHQQLMWTAAHLDQAQAFCADPMSGRHHWMRASSQQLPRCLVFDGEGYPYIVGKRWPNEPNFPQLLATPTQDDVFELASVWSVDPREIQSSHLALFALAPRPKPPAEENEDDYVERIADLYVHQRWIGAEMDGPARATDGPCSLRWPRSWGDPQPDGTRRVWELADAMIWLEVAGGLQSAPTFAEWGELARKASAPGWTVIGGREIPHQGGVAYEIGDVRHADPRIMRVTTTVIRPPLLATFAICGPREIHPGRGAEYSLALSSLRLSLT